MRSILRVAVAAALLFVAAVTVAAPGPSGPATFEARDARLGGNCPSYITEPRVPVGPEVLALGTDLRVGAEYLLEKLGLKTRVLDGPLPGSQFPTWAVPSLPPFPSQGTLGYGRDKNFRAIKWPTATKEEALWQPGLLIWLDAEGSYLHVSQGVTKWGRNALVISGCAFPKAKPEVERVIVERVVILDTVTPFPVKEIEVLEVPKTSIQLVPVPTVVPDTQTLLIHEVTVLEQYRTVLERADRIFVVRDAVVIPVCQIRYELVNRTRSRDVRRAFTLHASPAETPFVQPGIPGVAINVPGNLDVAVGHQGPATLTTRAAAFVDIKFGGGKEPAKEPKPPPDGDTPCPPGTAPDPPPSGGTPNAPPDDPSGEVPGSAEDQGPEVVDDPRIDDQPWAPAPPGTDGVVWLARW